MSSTEANSRTCLAIVLAAGEGTRMKSSRPKVLHEVGGRAMLAHVLASLADAGANAVAVVVGPGRDDVADAARLASPGAEIFVQTERLGTAHAVLAARAALARGYDDVLVLFADTPLVTTAALVALRSTLAQGAALAALGFEPDDPTGYGRLLIADGRLTAIREHKDATEDERRVGLCNAGLMALSGKDALRVLDAIGNGNAQHEFYLTDAVELARAAGLNALHVLADKHEVMGVNDRVQLAAAEAIFQARMREAAMRNGATLIAPETVFFSYDTKLGRDVLIEPNVVFLPGCVVEDGAIIHAFTHLEGATVRAGATAGPYARLRPKADLGPKSKVGNFVEIKAATIGAGAKISHLSYIGDASVGAEANIGAGVITCNYDGFNKARTEIGEGAFVGSNSSLVAPVRIGAGAYVGSGSVITKDVAPDALALARGTQAEKTGWAVRFRAAQARRPKKR
ncbi:MAG: UDP-N-acetylglucosamine diphosphorylase/glucosamine-phosphate N-acetyltransferase [Hyphomicrobiales bacterium]|jgi:bifunctional UDP-N-acetylglucosamine pyrophosphorylase/glucosamine-1-phosphate N-acetyltransferase|nr:UDP-N-acetylglucosamine diphosphorylase/glucosamine-phosphate N-acetyltransferase [Hyphomicrobiales bacterium]